MSKPTPSLWITAAGAVLIAVGSLGPWATALGLSTAGTDGDGVLTLIFAVGIGALLWAAWSSGRRGPLIACAIVAVLVAATGIYNISEINDTDQLARDLSEGEDLMGALEIQANASNLRSVGWGLYVVVIGAAGVALGSLALRRDLRTEDAAG
jgi:hypothetical protein